MSYSKKCKFCGETLKTKRKVFAYGLCYRHYFLYFYRVNFRKRLEKMLKDFEDLKGVEKFVDSLMVDQSNPGEIWKSVDGYEGLYEVSNQGRVRSLKRRSTIGKILKPKKEWFGYLTVSLSKINFVKNSTIHRLVAKAFIPLVVGKDVVNHKNGIPNDNRVENLEWVTQKENTHHAIKVLGYKPGKIGENNARSKLKEVDVVWIRANKDKFSCIEMAKKLKVSDQCVYDVITKRRWKHVK